VSCVTREPAEIDAELRQGMLPFVVEIAAEHQLFIRRHLQPAIGLDLGIELARTPSGIAKG
jgi:hypothetical protein